MELLCAPVVKNLSSNEEDIGSARKLRSQCHKANQVHAPKSKPELVHSRAHAPQLEKLACSPQQRHGAAKNNSNKKQIKNLLMGS